MLQVPALPSFCWDRPLEYTEYRLTVNGVPCPVRECRVSAMPFNRPFPGREKQRPLDQTEMAGFAYFGADETVKIEVESARAFSRATLRPLSAGIEPGCDGRKISFTLEKPGQYVLELDSEHHALHLFFDPPYAAPPPEARTAWYFGPGIHCPGIIRLRDGDTVYIDPGAWVYGSLYGEQVHDVRITGGGVLDGSYEERIWVHCSGVYTKSTVKFYSSERIRIEGITILNSALWSVNLFGCDDVELDRIKIVGQWRYNTDGIDLGNSRRVAIRDCFVRSFDDAIVLKGIDYWGADYPGWVYGRNVEDIAVEGCVLWCGWGRTCEIGIETSAPEYRRIRFEDCDLIHNSAVALDLQNGMGAEVHDVVFRDIRVEYQLDTLPEILQEHDGDVYAPGLRKGLPMLICSVNHRCVEDDSLPAGCTHDILFEDIQVFAEEGVPRLPVRIESSSPEAVFRHHVIRNLTVNGKRITDPAELDWQVADTAADTVLE